MFIFDGDNRKVHIDPAYVVDGIITIDIPYLWSRWCDWNAQTSGIYPRAFDILFIPGNGDEWIGPFLWIRNDLGWVGVPPPIDGVKIFITGGSFYGRSGTLPVMENLPGQETDLTIEQSKIVVTKYVSTSGPPAPTAAEIAVAVKAAIEPELNFITKILKNIFSLSA